MDKRGSPARSCTLKNLSYPLNYTSKHHKKVKEYFRLGVDKMTENIVVTIKTVTAGKDNKPVIVETVLKGLAQETLENLAKVNSAWNSAEFSAVIESAVTFFGNIRNKKTGNGIPESAVIEIREGEKLAVMPLSFLRQLSALMKSGEIILRKKAEAAKESSNATLEIETTGW